MGLTGGCACGSVRYELNNHPTEAGWCHCTTCQRLSGAPGMAWASVAGSDFVVTSGEADVRPVRLSSFADRTYCGRCGSPLTVIYHQQPDETDFTVGTLDEPSAVAPSYHIFWSSKPDWFQTDDGLPTYPRFRPGTIIERD